MLILFLNLRPQKMSHMTCCPAGNPAAALKTNKVCWPYTHYFLSATNRLKYVDKRF